MKIYVEFLDLTNKSKGFEEVELHLHEEQVIKALINESAKKKSLKEELKVRISIKETFNYEDANE